MRPLGTILLIEDLTGSYGLAGGVGATTTLVAAVASPRLGALTDRYGSRPVLLWTLVAHIVGTVGLVIAVYADMFSLTFFAFAAIIGISTVPFPSLSRARWAERLGPGPALDRAQAMESVADELGFVIGPIVVVSLAVVVAPSAGLLSVILFVGLASVVLALQPPAHAHEVRTTGVDRASANPSESVIGQRGVQVLFTALFFLGLIFGAVELMAVAFAEGRGAPGAAGYLVAIFAFGSMLSAVITGARAWKASPPRRFVMSAVALALGTIPILLADSIPLMALAVFITGLAISPTLIAANSVVEGLAPRNRLNEAFSWLGAAIASGVAIGSVIAGVVIDEVGTRGGQAVGVVAGGLSLVVVIAGAKTLNRRSPSRTGTGPVRK